MKTKPLLVAASIVFVLPSFAGPARIDAYKEQLRKARPPELALETARLISEKQADVTDAVTAAITLKTPAAPLVVGSVAKMSPQFAAAAAAAAIVSEPKQAVVIVRAAVSAAPSEAAAIVTATCQARPVSFYSIGVSAAAAAPQWRDKIIPALLSALPLLKPVLDRAEKDFKAANQAPSLALLLKHAENILVALARDQNEQFEMLLAKETESALATKLATRALAPPPVLGPPFVPGGTPAEIPAASTSEDVPNCRCYSSP